MLNSAELLESKHKQYCKKESRGDFNGYYGAMTFLGRELYKQYDKTAS